MYKNYFIILTLCCFASCHPQKEVYMFTSFHEPANEGLRFLWSKDAYHWNDLNASFLLPAVGADKIMRLHACSDRFESGRVVLPRSARWLDEYILELIGFPGTKHDDQVDSTTQALDFLREPDLVATYIKAYS